MTFTSFTSPEESERYQLIHRLISRFPEIKLLGQELKIIFAHRIEARTAELTAIHKMLLSPKANIPQTVKDRLRQVELDLILINLVRKEASIFWNDLHKYEKRFKEGVPDTLRKAKQGQTKSICRLITWDKASIGFDFIIKEISRRQLSTKFEKEFFEALSDSLRKKSMVQSPALEGSNRGLVRAARFYVSIFEQEFDVTISQATKMIFNGLMDLKDPPPVADDIDYFRKFLKRHRVIP